jgi:tRNA threonylcarbamoyl adenosine modification protein YeaZ
MIALAIETSTAFGSVAVCAFGEIIFEQRFEADRSHSSTLFKALEKARCTVAKFDRIAVGIGPGSYSGVRIGIAAAIGMSLVLQSELIGIPSAAALEVPEQDFVVISDARRGAFYFTLMRNGVCCDGPKLVSEAEARDEMRAFPVYATGPIAAFPSIEVAQPAALTLVKLAVEGSSVVQIGDLEPLYLREPHITQPKDPPARLQREYHGKFEE